MSSFNFKSNAASDIVEKGNLIDSKNLKTQEYLDKSAQWTNEKQMMLKETKNHAL